MRRLRERSVVVALFVLLPTAAFAQASITGVVKDTSGAVLPGVSVEASSPALIEKTRTAITDGTGQYRIIDLRAGTYAVTFTTRRTGKCSPTCMAFETGSRRGRFSPSVARPEQVS